MIKDTPSKACRELDRADYLKEILSMMPTDLHLGVDESKVNSCKSVGRHKWHILLRLPAVRLHHSLQPLVERDDRSRHRAAVLKVLELAAEDQRVLAQMTEDPAQVLNEFDLTDEECAALASGDIRFIEKTVGKLSQKQKTWLECRLQQEKW